MPLLKKIFKKIQGLNREYVLLFAVLAVLGLLIYSSIAVSQVAPPEQITLSTLYPAPLGQFNEVSAKLFRDFDNPTYRFIDPAGMSQIEALRVMTRLITGYIAGPGTNPLYTVNFTSGDAAFNIVYAVRFYMDDPGPTSQRGGGKYVYDIAEGVYAQGCEAGDVVLISDNDQSDVMKSSGSFNNRVAGVISGDPKIYMGSNKNKVPLALAGLVKCKASAENGSIKRGDLLVTASLPGHAMKAAPYEVKPGMIIGKAMEPLKENTGRILVLVNKQ
ncbi:MAG: hypothetical protein L6416_07715 [Candidatus Omnitrophica bacterium]|nr:hypothetical protein [Candidatus Omnitrophota bacterium]